MEEGNESDRLHPSPDVLPRPKSALPSDYDFDQLSPRPPSPSPRLRSSSSTSIQDRSSTHVSTPRRRSLSFQSHESNRLIPPAPCSSRRQSASSSFLVENEYVPIMGTVPSRLESKEKDQDEMDPNGTVELTGCAGSCFCHPESKCHRALALFLMCILGFGSYFCYDNPGALQVRLYLNREFENFTTFQEIQKNYKNYK